MLRRNLNQDVLVRASGSTALGRDFSALIRALLDTYQATFDPDLIERAVALQRLADRSSDPALPPAIESLLAAREDPVATENRVVLAAITGDRMWTALAGTTLGTHRQVIVAGDPRRVETQELLDAARSVVGTADMIFLVGGERIRARLGSWMPYVRHVTPVEPQVAVATLCANRACLPATAEVEQVIRWQR